MQGEKPWTDKYIREIKQKLKNGTAKKMMINEVMMDINNHLATPCGTISNYSGIFGQSAIKAIIDNYPEYIDEDIVKASEEVKVQGIINHIINAFVSNKKIQISPQYIRLVLDYLMRDKFSDNQQQNQYIVVGYPECQEGLRTFPQNRSY